jgi:hypothetical protein
MTTVVTRPVAMVLGAALLSGIGCTSRTCLTEHAKEIRRLAIICTDMRPTDAEWCRTLAVRYYCFDTPFEWGPDASSKAEELP